MTTNAEADYQKAGTIEQYTRHADAIDCRGWKRIGTEAGGLSECREIVRAFQEFGFILTEEHENPRFYGAVLVDDKGDQARFQWIGN